MKLDAVETIELIATYEDLKKIPLDERVSAYFGDYGMHYLVNDVDIDKAIKLRDEALIAMGMTHEEYLLDKQFMYRQNIRLKMREGMMADKIKEKDTIVFVNPQAVQGTDIEKILKGDIEGVNAETKMCAVNFKGYKIVVPFRNILGIQNDIEQDRHFGFDNCEPLLDARESDADTLVKETREEVRENNMLSDKFDLVVIFDKPVLFTCERLNRNLPIEGVYYYDIRHDDECRGDMAQLKDRVMVNHWGTVISKERFEPREVGDKIFTTAEGIDMDEGDYDYLGETLSVSEYLEKYDELVREYCEPKEENNLEMGM